MHFCCGTFGPDNKRSRWLVAAVWLLSYEWVANYAGPVPVFCQLAFPGATSISWVCVTASRGSFLESHWLTFIAV